MKKAFLLLSVILLSLPVFGMGTTPNLPGISKLGNLATAELMSIDADLAAAAKKLSIVLPAKQDARPILLNLYNDHKSIVDVAVITPAGKLRFIEPAAYKGSEGKNISRQKHIRTLIKRQKPLLSGQFKTVEGFYACSLSYPIFSSKKKLLGFVSTLIKPDALMGNIVNRYSSAFPTLEALMVQMDGRIIYDNDSDQIGRMILSEPDYSKDPSLLKLINRIKNEASGIGSYLSLSRPGNPQVKKETVWKTLVLHGTKWRLIISKIIF